MYKVICISFLWLFFFSAAQAQEKKYVSKDTPLIRDEKQMKLPATEQVMEQVPAEVTAAKDIDWGEIPDTSLYVNSLRLPPDSIQSWKNLKEYAYAKYMDSLLKDKQKKNMEPKHRSQSPGFLNSFLSSTFLRVFLWILAVFFILFVLYRLFLAEGVFKRETKMAKMPGPGIEDEIISGKIDFDHLINQASHAGNFREAVRYQYLRTLHKLANKNFVELARDKTNFQYVHEIADPVFQNEFASLTLKYEYVWYGEFMIDSTGYQKLENGFTRLNQKL